MLVGDFRPLDYEVFAADTNITVAEVTKGRSNMETFTLLWGGIPTKPIAFNATESEVRTLKSLVTDLSYSYIFLSPKI